MATVAEGPNAAEVDGWMIAPPQQFVIFNVPWDGYEMMLKVLDDRPIRVNYLRGTMELMSPGVHHEEIGRLLGIVIQVVTEEVNIPCIGLKSTTWKHRVMECGLEPDECFYIANTGRVLARRRQIDLEVDPPPDLCIEVEITRSAVDRMAIYAGLGVPEVWRHGKKSLRVAVLQPDGTYAEQESSPSLPFLPMAEVFRLVSLVEDEGMDHSSWGRLVRAWVRENILPGYEPPAGRAD